MDWSSYRSMLCIMYGTFCSVARGVCVVLVVATLTGLLGCGGDDGAEPFSEVRTVRAPEAIGPVTNPHLSGAVPGPGALAGSPQFHWETPAGWVTRAPQELRVINLGIADAPEVECYVTHLPGMAGGLEANLNRWRTQMSLPAFGPGELDALPRIEVLGTEASLVEFEGAFAGMGDTDVKEGYKMLGVIASRPGDAVFVKMTGPADVVTREKENFLAFSRSLHVSTGESTAPPMVAVADPHAGLPTPIGQSDPISLEWVAPESWQRAPDRAMRLVTYVIDGAECYVTVLTGTAGGAAMNINRWVTQMGQPELTPEQLADLPAITVLGQDSPLVEATGAFTGMDGTTQADSMLLGVVREDPVQSVFIKMTGPESVVRAERDRFIAFCESIQ